MSATAEKFGGSRDAPTLARCRRARRCRRDRPGPPPTTARRRASGCGPATPARRSRAAPPTPCAPTRRGDRSASCAGNPFKPAPHTVVSAPEAELARAALQVHCRVDLLDAVPGNVHLPAAPDEDCGHDGSSLAHAFELEVVDLAAAPSVAVHELMVEHAEPDVDRLAHPCPAFVRIISGTAATAIARMTTRYSSPNAFPSFPFAYGPMYALSFATRRIGTYVRGSATAEKITEYSVTSTGSTPVRMTSDASAKSASQVSVKRGAPEGFRYLPHSQPRNCARLYAPENATSSAAPPIANSMPTSASRRPISPSGACAISAAVPRKSAEMPCGSRSAPAQIISAKERRPPRP